MRMSRSQNFKSYGRGKHSNHPNTVVHSSIQFDKFFCENSNKPTAAKSAGTIGKWGITSFTSIRSSTFSVGHSKETSRFSSLGKKRSQPAADNGLPVKRSILNNNAKRECSPILPTRKFFKSRNSLDDPNQKSYKSSNSGESKRSGRHSRSVDENKKHKNSAFEENKPKNAPVIRTFEKPTKASSKRLAPLKLADEAAIAISDFNNLQNLPSPPKERDKPPIVLRIFKGTSQLISETGSKSSDLSDEGGSRENADPESRLLDDAADEAAAIADAAEPAFCTRSSRRRTPEKSKSPTPEPPPVAPVKIPRRHVEKSPPPPAEAAAPSVAPVKISRRHVEKAQSPTSETPTVAPVKISRRHAAEEAESPEPIAPVKISRRHVEKAKSPSPEPPPIAPVKISRRHVERAPSPEVPPEPSARATRSARRRSPEKPPRSPQPAAEPVITTRSLRRRGAAAATQPEAPPSPPAAAPPPSSPAPHTSPKRTLRSNKNMAPPPSKIVITNLKSDHPSVYINDSTAGAQSSCALPSPSRKEAKETRSYSNRHKHKHPSRHESAAKSEAELKKVEEILADLSDGAVADAGAAPPEPDAAEVRSAPTADLSKSSADSSLDSDRAELLQLLEDEDEDDTPLSSLAAATQSAKPPKLPEVAETAVPAKEEPAAADEAVPAVVNSDSELKIKIKISDLRKPSVEVEPQEELPEAWIASAPAEPLPDSADSGVCVPTDSQLSSCSAAESVDGGNKSPEAESQMSDLAKECEDRLSAANSDSETKSDAASTSGCAVPTAAAIKKGSIFKHRASSNGNKKRALYKHKWVDEKDGAQNVDEEKSSPPVVDNKKALDAIFDADMDDMPLTKFIRKPTENSFEFDEPSSVTGLKCPKKNKDYYTVVRNVKKAHQIQESGEFQEFNDDVEYILDALQDNNPIGLRCLSAITLATKCTEPAFRMHVRAHGTVTKFFRALHDATKDQSLGLCTATVMFVLSQDRLNMDLDRDSLELMLNLLESDASHTKALADCGLTDSQLTKTRDKVGQICADIQAQGHAKHLNLDNITVGHLSMETLLSLTSKRAGEWFKEELRELGGLEHIIKTVAECCKHVDDTANAWSATSLEKIRKVDRCLRVLENVTMQNEQNNCYLLEYQNGILIDTLVRMYKVCDYEIPLYPTYSIDDKDSTGAVLRECLIANLKVLINITHDYQMKSHGSNVIGSRPGVIESSLHVLLQVPQYIPKEEKFDLMLLTLILLINLVEHCETNRKAIIEAKAPSDEESIFETKAREPAVKALVSMFYNYEELARNEEKKTDAILEGENAEKPPTNASQKVHEDFIEETISQLVQKAGQNMEHTLIAAYVAMTIGYLIIDNEEFETFVRNHLPEKNFQFMISVLQKFYSFMTLTASGGTVSNRGMKSIQMVIQKLIDSDHRHGFDVQCPSNAETPAPKAEPEDKGKEASPPSTSSSSNFCEAQSASGVAVSAS